MKKIEAANNKENKEAKKDTQKTVTDKEGAAKNAQESKEAV